ncbi:hypothetical protein Sjap_009230 [Stephania japonica]|uniref:Uncharacterized protein n=1 Tax=Stephania japonica TaxID=461633 RepID=A0AAP0JQZ8_9MAGN
MSHSLTPSPHAPITLSTRPLKKTQLPIIIRSHRLHSTDELDLRKHLRNYMSMPVIEGLSIGENQNASAAGKRKPAAPQGEEKKDPNVSGVQAKVLASKKRKEAMKEAMAKLKEKGKAIVIEEKKE